MTYQCTRCKRALLRPAPVLLAAGIQMGRVCARKLAMELMAPKSRASAPRAAAKAAGWTQQDLFGGVAR